MIVGIDVSKESFDSCWRTNGKLCEKAFRYDSEGINQLLSLTDENAHYVMEATGIYHLRLALALHKAGRRVSVVNPLVIKRFGQMRLSQVKSDRADARLIQAYGEENTLSPWQPSKQVIVELQQAHGWLDDLIVERTRLLNREEALRLQVRINPFVRREMKKQRKLLDEQIAHCERHLEAIVKKHFADLYQNLLSIPGVGQKTAVELLIVTEGFNRFTTSKALSAYVGVSPTTYESGTSVKGRGSISKRGKGRLRQLLYMCSWTARSSNRGCRQLHQRLSDTGKPPKLISIAIAHKLLRQIFAVATSNERYCETLV